MFMPSNNDFMPVPVEFVRLQPEELLFHSFLIFETEKTWSGYELKSDISYRCHFTNQRLIFEPIAATSDGLMRSRLAQVAIAIDGDLGAETLSCFELPMTDIQRFKEVRGLNPLHSYVKIVLNQPPIDLKPHDIVLAPQSIQKPGKASCAHAFALLGNGLLPGGAGQGSQFHHLKDNPAKVAQFQQELDRSQIPVLVDFLAPGCKPCEMFTPILQEAILPFGDRLKLLQVNLEDTPSIPMQYRVECFPTVLLFKDGTLVERIEGVIPAALITKVLSRHFIASRY